jgi:lipopolysaccharide/colanic/teichoic acid biosynthesis glycosyltransferase
MKRCFDIVVSLIILCCFLPFGILLAIAIALESRGGVFYRQERVGKNGVKFRLWKFRTMRKNADKLGQLTVGMRDPRITRVGLFIRKVKLDEFPQFLNVLLGEMSVVGPRPEVQEYVDLYSPDQRIVLSVKPGITDYASLEYFNENELLGNSDNPRETYINEVMPAKIELNKKYISNPTLGTDLKIMWQTFLKIISK